MGFEIFKRKKYSDSFGELKEDYFDFEKIEKYFLKKKFKNSLQVISDRTWNDLDFPDIFMFLDRTVSKVGQQFLYSKVRNIPSSDEEIIRREKLIDQLTSDENLRLDVHKNLSFLKRSDAYYIPALFQEKLIERPSWFFLIPLLSVGNLLCLILSFFNPAFIVGFILITVLNLGIHYWNKKNLTQYLASMPQLFVLNKVAKKLLLKDKLKNNEPEIEEATKFIDKMNNRASFFRLEANMQGDLSIIPWLLMELFKILFLIEPLFLFNVLKHLEAKKHLIEKIYTYVGEIDMAYSIASLRFGLSDWCKLEIAGKENYLVAENAYHPLIESCVKNSFVINGKSILLTGSNMSGKTSFIRTMGLNVICGLTLNTCFASKFIMSRMRVFSAIRISDDLMNSKSYYFEEVLSIKEMVNASEESGYSNLFLLDEIYKGTNTVERISAGKAVLSVLARNNNIVLVSTHDIELTDLLKDEYELYHFSESINEQTVDFDYKIKQGKLQNRNAIKILEINDYPQEIIEEAMKIAKELDNQREKN